MKRNPLPLCLTVSIIIVTFAILAGSAAAQEPELDEFIYLPIVFKSPSSLPDCSSYEPNDIPQQANWIQDGEIQVQCIIPATDIDWVKFSVSAESEVVLEGADEGGDLELRLYDSNLNELEYAYSWTDRPAQIAYRCGLGGEPLAAGLYYARVEHWLNSEKIPSYEITLSVNACPTPVVLPNHSYFTTSYALYVVGEVQTNGDIGLSGIEVIANLFNGDDQLIDTGTDYVALSVLPPGDKTCFRLGFGEWDVWSYYEFEMPTYYSTSDGHLQNMTVHDDNGTYNPDDGSYRILGFVRNDNDFQVTSVQSIFTLYDASGTVVGCDYTYVSSTNLNPGQSSSFEMTFSGYSRDYADVASYRVQVDGYLQ
jgi:hypothetical protein